MLSGPPDSVERAHKLRLTMSLPEVLLWRELRKRPGGYKFRRQHPAGRFIADLFCHEARLIVDVDGKSHPRGDQSDRDALRDRWFEERKFHILRIAATDVLGNLKGSIRGIVAAADDPASRSGEE